MTDITCNVIKDLLPLYADDALSSDSRALVEKHLAACEACREYHHMLRTPEETLQKKRADDQAAFRRIRSRLTRKRLITVLVTALCVAALTFGLFYGFVLHETYIPYKESGLYVADEALRSDRRFYKVRGIFSPDGTSLFLYLTTTAYTEHSREEGSFAGSPVISLDEEALKTTWEDDDGTVTEQVCREIYYVPEEAADRFLHGMTYAGETPEEIQKSQERQIGEMKAVSVLVWQDTE